MGWEKGGWRLAAVVAAVAWLVEMPACASAWMLENHRYVNRESGISIAAPDGKAWSRADVDGALLSFADDRGGRLSWIRQCGRAQPPPRLASRQLLIGLQVEGEPEGSSVTVQGAPGWRLRARVRQDGETASIDAVTRIGQHCTDDFLLVTPKPDAAERAAFEAWWRSFRETAGGAAGTSGPTP